MAGMTTEMSTVARIVGSYRIVGTFPGVLAGPGAFLTALPGPLFV
jgi:hypothetical protein